MDFFFFNVCGSLLEGGKSEGFYDFFREKCINYFYNFHLREKTLEILYLMTYICNLYYYAVNANEKQKWMMASSLRNHKPLWKVKH